MLDYGAERYYTEYVEANSFGAFCFLRMPSFRTNLYLRTKRPSHVDYKRPAVRLDTDGKHERGVLIPLKAGNMAEIIIGAMPKRGKKPVDHTGERFGRLVVISYYGRSVGKNKCGNAVWRCKCDCGKETLVIARSLIDGSTRSCGCLHRDNLVEMIKRNAGSNKKNWGEARFHDLYLSYQRRAKKASLDFSLSLEQFKTITKGECFYCGTEPSQIIHAGHGVNGEYIYNGIDRIDSTKGYTIDNVRSCCKHCNIAKHTMTESEFYGWVEKVYTHLHGATPR